MRPADALVIAEKELREILRDRRALFFAFLLPLLLHPVLFFGLARMEELRRHAAEARPSRIGVARAPAGLMERLGAEPDLEVAETPPDLDLLERGDLDLLVVLDPPARGSEAPLTALIYLEGGSPASEEGRRRVEKALEGYRDQLLAERFAARGAAVDPARLLSVSFRDVSLPGERAGALLGRFLPFILVALLLTGGSFAAIDLVAGEKERGTLETLFVQPLSPLSVVLGKFLAALAASLTAVVLNLLGMAGALALGLAPPGAGGAAWTLPGAGSAAALVVLLLPLAVLTTAVLLAVSTHARSLREAQTFLLPLTLLALLPALMAGLPEVRLSKALAVMPVAGTALAIREALLGEYRWGYLAAAWGSSALYAVLALRWAARLLAREDLRLGLEPEPVLGAATGEARARRGLAFGALMVLLVAYLGSALQRPEGPLGIWGGLALTLWVVVLVPSLLYLRVFHLPMRETLGLHIPRPRDLLTALVLVPVAAVLLVAYMAFQDSVLPFPEGLRRELEKLFAAEGLGPLRAALLMAVSPAVCEETLWRGVVQGELWAERRPARTILWVGVFFGIFHLDVYRLIPTAFLGAVLASLRLSTGSIFPCVLFHGLYNGLLIFESRAAPGALEKWAARPGVAVIAGLVLVGTLRWRWIQRREERDPSAPR